MFGREGGGFFFGSNLFLRMYGNGMYCTYGRVHTCASANLQFAANGKIGYCDFQDAIERNGILYLIPEMGQNGLRGGGGCFLARSAFFLLFFLADNGLLRSVASCKLRWRVLLKV